MDWFHCNRCLNRSGSKFAVSSCGHIFCDACIKPKQCCFCGSSCSYLAITDRMKPEEKMFFQDPVKLLQSRLKQIAQIATFQQSQMKRVIGHFKHKSAELEKHLKQVTEQSNRHVSDLERENSDLKRQLLELKREHAELKKPLSQRRVSPGMFQINSQRVSLPVAVTPPVSPRTTPSHIGSAEARRLSRDRAPNLSFNTPGSSMSISSHSSLREYSLPTQSATPIRTRTPNIFQFTSGLTIQSPRQ